VFGYTNGSINDEDTQMKRLSYHVHAIRVTADRADHHDGHGRQHELMHCDRIFSMILATKKIKFNVCSERELHDCSAAPG